MADWQAQVEEALGARPTSVRPLGGGSVAQVFQFSLPEGIKLVAKVGNPGDGLALEGWMLRYLREHSALPVPKVLFEDDSLLVMEFIPSRGGIDGATQRHAADLLAGLHAVRGPAFGLERDTLIGGLHQPNPLTHQWLPFFRDQRLLYMGAECVRANRMPAGMLGRLERLAARLEEWIEEPAAPSLLHGDMWGGNVLAAGGRVAGFIDPAIYYGDPEIELAFSTLFGTFSSAFFKRYEEHRPLREGFFEARRELYNLYPLLVHVRLFGGHYVDSVASTLRRFGC